MQGSHDLLHRAAWKISTADGTGEERIAGDQLFFCGEVEADAAFGMARGVQDAGGEGSGSDGFSSRDAAIDVDFPGGRHADPCGLHIEHLQQSVIILVEQDRSARGGAKLHGSADVVDMGVRDDDLFDLQVVLADERENILDIIAGIDDHGFAGRLIADDGAVALQRTDRENFVDHGLIVATAACCC